MNASDIGPVSMEKVEHPVNALGKKTKWLQSARDRMKKKGTEGSLTRIAAKHGETAMEYAHQHEGSSDVSPKVRKKIQFAINAQK